MLSIGYVKYWLGGGGITALLACFRACCYMALAVILSLPLLPLAA